MKKNKMLLRFLSCIFACGLFTFGDITSAMAVSCDSDEDSSVTYFDNSDGGPFSVSFSYGSVNGIGICSIDAGDSYGELGSPDTVSGNTKTKKSCWCQITDIDGNSNSSPNAVFLKTFGTLSICQKKCAQICADALAGDRDIRATLYSDPDAGDMCEEQPWGGACNTAISLVTLDPDICDEWAENESVDRQNWTVTLMPGGNETLSGLGVCFDVAGDYPGEVSQTQPPSGTGSECWCGIEMYNDGKTKYLSGMIPWFYVGDNWGGDPSSCEADCPWACVKIMQQGLCSFVKNADELSMCIYEDPSEYSVSYDCGYNGSGSPSDSNSYSSGDTVYTQSSSACTPSPGYEFSYWDCNTGTNITPGDSFTIYDNTTCTAQWLSSQYPFSLTTTTIDGNQFTFNMSAKGTFYVDCGTGGTLSGDGVSGNTITRSNVNDSTSYTCTYASRDARTIRIGGLATEYHTDYAESAIRFWGSGNYVASISGDLSRIFPLYGTHAGEYPSFSGTFSGCERLTSIPDTLFSGYTTGGEYMFAFTFAACRELTSLPSGLFSGITSGAPYMFHETFYACSSLTSLPSSLFSGITSGASNMFTGTFGRCTGLTGYVPPTLFAGLINNGSPDVQDFMAKIFGNTGSLDTSCPNGMTEYTTGYESYWVDDDHSVNWPTHYVSCVTGQSQTYTVSFAAGDTNNDGTGTAATGSTASISNQSAGTSITLPASTFTAPSGYTFNGWSCNNNIGYRAAVSTFTMPSANVTCTAQWIQYPFSLTTTSQYFKFKLTAAGTFTVDCGTGGTLSGTGVSGNTITRSNVNDSTSYACQYSSAGTHTVQFGGQATGYSTGDSDADAAISFYGDSSITTISGDLSRIFPLYGTHAGEYPSFYGTFSGCERLTSIPNTLFSGYTTGGHNLFAYTFDGCTGLTSLPTNLFTNITTPSPYMFNSTFDSCSGLRGYVPPTLFAGLINNGSPDVQDFMAKIFGNTGSLDTSCPNGMTEYTTGYESYWVDSNNNVDWPTHYVSCVTATTYNVSFAAGDTNNDGTGTAATGSTASISNQSAGTSITLPASTFTAPSGYTFNGWSCNNNIGLKAVDTTFAMPAADVTCTAQWSGNSITVNFDSSATSCDYGGTLNVPTPAPRVGYVFTGWHVNQCSLSGLDPSISSISWDATHARWKPISSTGYTMADEFSTENSSDLNPGEWAVTFSYGTVKGMAKCSSTNGDWATSGTPSDTNGQYCWCQATNYTPNGGNQCNVASPSWVYYNSSFNANNCARECAKSCASCGKLNQSYVGFRRALFGAQ